MFINDKIVTFLRKQTAVSVSCVNEINEPYSFSCFFTFDDRENLLYYNSSSSAYHSKILIQNSKVSGTIMPDKLNKTTFKGIQFTGEVLAENNPLVINASKNYHLKFPFAIAVPGIVWTIRLNHRKMTNDVFGIIEKHSWQREKETDIEPV